MAMLAAAALAVTALVTSNPVGATGRPT